MGQPEIMGLLRISPMTAIEMHSRIGGNIRGIHKSVDRLLRRNKVFFELERSNRGNGRPVRKFFLCEGS